MISKSAIRKVKDYLWEIPKDFRDDMRAPARIFADEALLDASLKDESLDQLVNVATLPGIQKWALAMPDIHEGYGFPVGGVAAVSAKDGVISPGGIGYDINCGVRLLGSQLKAGALEPHLEKLANQMQRDVPSGLGRGGNLELQAGDFNKVLNLGVRQMLQWDYGTKEDLEFIESHGCLAGADASLVSETAKKRGLNQLGTIGSGNHFLEVERVARIFDEKTAQAFGIFQDQATILIHTGSRGLGHQVATDYINIMLNALKKYRIELPDRELAASPFSSPEGQNYFGAMSAAANFAWANRQLITYNIRKAWGKILGTSAGELKIIYDVAHNIAKLEEYGGTQLIVHRKGATRAFGPGREELPALYMQAGQPVFIPGTMGTVSYILAGTDLGREQSFSSSCHGAGRQMSRHAALKKVQIQELKKTLADKNIIVRTGSARGLIEEAPEAYKDVEKVVGVVAGAGIARIVAKLEPLAVIKG